MNKLYKLAISLCIAAAILAISFLIGASFEILIEYFALDRPTATASILIAIVFVTLTSFIYNSIKLTGRNE